MRQVAAITNAWDRDVALKRSLGVPADIFQRTARVLGGRGGGVRIDEGRP